MVYFRKETNWYNIGQLLVGFGFLFLGLEYMKSSIAYLAESFDISPFAHWNAYLFFLIGFVLTAIIQSSSASMVITLSALSSGMIELDAAAAMVIGSDLGTTITVLFGGIKGTPAKKRVALSHFLFNFIVDILALIALYPLLDFITHQLQFTNPLLTLVAFHSAFNLVGAFLFLPFLGVFARFLEKRFHRDDEIIAQYISQVPVKVPEAGIEAIRKELGHLLQRIFILNNNILQLPLRSFLETEKEETISTQPIIDQYENIKELEGEIMEYYIQLQNERLESDDSEQLQQFLHAIRHAMTGAKGLKDVSHNIQEFDRSINDDSIELLQLLKDAQTRFYEKLYHIFHSPKTRSHFEELAQLKKESKQTYNQFLDRVYRKIPKDHFTDFEISTLLNVNREIHTSNKAFVLAVKDFLLQSKQALDFETIPATA